jgi:hypothetical protein
LFRERLLCKEENVNVRELLQTEIWSKETSRRILRRIWRIARPVFAVTGVLVLLLGVAFAIEWYWMTSGERTAGRAALAKIEELERFEGNKNDGFDEANRQAKNLTIVADQKAWTLRDRNTAGLLEFYRWELESDHESRVREMEVKTLAAENHLELHSNPDLEKKLRDTQEQIHNSMRSSLHKELD